MMLGSDASSLAIKNQRHFAGVNCTQAKEDSTAGTWLPAWHLVAGLQLGIKHACGTAPDMKIVKVMPGHSAAGKEICRTDTMLIW